MRQDATYTGSGKRRANPETEPGHLPLTPGHAEPAGQAPDRHPLMACTTSRRSPGRRDALWRQNLAPDKLPMVNGRLGAKCLLLQLHKGHRRASTSVWRQ